MPAYDSEGACWDCQCAVKKSLACIERLEQCGGELSSVMVTVWSKGKYLSPWRIVECQDVARQPMGDPF